MAAGAPRAGTDRVPGREPLSPSVGAGADHR
jgi:hypothetical protein